ncbi:MAG: YlxR family protein [Acidimicrobiia bacterium]|nr:YlxR family protein [Acidimicrobiia bacterium]
MVSRSPRRTCIGCRRVADPSALVRVIRRDDGTLVAGRSLPGRGAWLCAGSPGCVELAQRRGAFARALRGPVDPASVEGLAEAVSARAKMTGRPGLPAGRE